MGSGFFPLDDELGLLPGMLSPTLAEGVIRLGTELPFDRAASTLAFFWRVELSPTTMRRHTEAAGAAVVGEQTARVEQLEASLASPPDGPARQQVSLDGAMVPLVGGVWAEVKTLAVGTLTPPPEAGAVGDSEGVHATDLSYFSRMTDAATFSRLAAVEFDRRGTERAGQVIAVMDGAEWQQTVVDRYRPDAVRVLDFPHAVEHLSAVAHAVWGREHPEAVAWIDTHAHQLKHTGPDAVVGALRAMPVDDAHDPAAARRAQAGTIGYFEKRLEQIHYPAFRAQGYPIGSGLVESANKLVVEARLKGSGMHWDRRHVDPMLALRTVTCADRWGETVPGIQQRLRAAAAQRRADRHRSRQPALPAPDTAAPPTLASDTTPARPVPTRPKLIVDGRPSKHHPWRSGLNRQPTGAGKL